MALAKSVAAALALGAFLEALAVWRPERGFLQRRPQVSVLWATVGLGTAAVVIAVMLAAPIVHGVAGWEGWSSTFVTYFMASNNRLFGGPYAFFWTAPWMYPVGSLTPFIALGALLALAGGYYALPTYKRAALVLVVAAACLLVAFLAGEIYALWAVRDGLPV